MTTTSLPRFLGLTCLFLAWSLPSPAQECGEWQLTDHRPYQSSNPAITHGNGRFVASGLVSEDGVRDFIRLVPHARYVDVSRAGHMVAGDRNDAFSNAVIDFLEDLRHTGRV